MENFVAIDFETANFKRSSVCSVGVVVVKGGKIARKFYSLIRPLPNYYCQQCAAVHGLGRQDTDAAPSFDQVWKQIAPLIEDMPLVAHNKSFDESCLKAVFDLYQMDYPGYLFLDTLAAARKAFPQLSNHQLHTVAYECGYDLRNHHHALADAEACAEIAIRIL